VLSERSAGPSRRDRGTCCVSRAKYSTSGRHDHPERGMVTLRSETRNQRNEVVQLLIVKVVVLRRANAEEVTAN
jgi:hypothetical protein